MANSYKKEIERQFRVCDQMLTAYSILRDKYSFKATLITLIIFGSAIMLCAASFIPDTLISLGIKKEFVAIGLGFFSALVLFTSIAELCLKWRALSQKYSIAANNILKIKQKIREIDTSYIRIGIKQYQDINQLYTTIMSELPSIPDEQFIRLKAKHLRKVELSKMCSHAKGCPLWILKISVLWQGIKAAFSKQKVNK